MQTYWAEHEKSEWIVVSHVQKCNKTTKKQHIQKYVCVYIYIYIHVYIYMLCDMQIKIYIYSYIYIYV